jgi:hypothetical protein
VARLEREFGLLGAQLVKARLEARQPLLAALA